MWPEPEPPHTAGVLHAEAAHGREVCPQGPPLLCKRFTSDAAADQRSQKDQENSKTVFSSGLLIVDVQNLPLVQAHPTCKRDS